LTLRRMAAALAPWAILTGIAAGCQAEPAAESIIAPGATPQKIANNFAFTEGPAADSKGNVYFTDQPNDRILRWGIDGKITTFLQPAGRSNGLCLDKHSDIWACADGKNELWRIHPTRNGMVDANPAANTNVVAGGISKVIVAAYKDKLLNGPNDIWLRPDAGLYITDPYYQRPYWHRGPKEQDVEGVYYLAPGATELVRVADDLKKPNGIIGTPDGKTLYVADIDAGKTYAYTIERDGTLSRKRPFCDKGSDGMTIDSDGNVYLTGQGVTVFDPSGKQIEQIPIPEPWTANVCFGGKDRKTLFITASTAIYTLSMRTHGVGSQ